jgi:hypothetical protein
MGEKHSEKQWSCSAQVAVKREKMKKHTKKENG